MDELSKQVITLRKRKFRNLLGELESCISGQLFPLLPYISNRQGNYSEQKTKQLVNHILNNLETSNENLFGFYRSLFYCAIRAATTPYSVTECGSIFGIIGDPDQIDTTFSDLISLLHAEDVYIMEDLIRLPMDSTLATVMTALYEVLSENKTEKSNPLFGKVFHEDISDKPNWAAFPESIDDKNEPFDSFFDEYLDFQKNENLRIRKTFPSANDYCKEFENLISQFEENFQFEIINNHIHEMIDHFLTDQGLSLYSDEDAYITLCTYIKKTIKTGKQLHTKGELLNGNRKR